MDKHGEVKGFVRGFFAPLRLGLPLWSVRAVRRTAILPLLINIAVVLFVLIAFVWGNVSLLQGWIEKLGGGIGWKILLILAGILLTLAFLILIAFIFTFLANLIAGFFNEQLSRTVLLHLNAAPMADPADEPFFPSLIRDIKVELQNILFFVSRMILLILISIFIPVLGGFLFAAGSTLLTLYALALEFFSVPLERYRVSFRDRQRYLRRHRGLTMGFGTAMLLLALIPVVNLFIIPLGVMTASALFAEIGESFPQNSIG